MKKRIAVIIFTLSSIGLFGFDLIVSYGKAGYTGSPGENSCNYCHNSYTLNSGTGSVEIITNIPNDLYEPDSVYQITIVVTKPGAVLFGFGCEALKSDNTDAGTFNVTNIVKTRQLTADNGRQNMTHKLNDGASTDSAVFTFNWTAPPTNVGTINFYYTGVSANNDGLNTFDYVYQGNHSINSTSTIGIEDLQQPYPYLEVKTFPATQLVDISFLLDVNAFVQLSLMSVDGKLVKTAKYEKQTPGEKTYTMYTSGLHSGVYILIAKINEVLVCRKFLLVQ